MKDIIGVLIRDPGFKIGQEIKDQQTKSKTPFILKHNTMLTDTSLMPFGKYKGLPMQDIPVHYLHWLWHSSNTGFLKYDDQNKNHLALYDMNKPGNQVLGYIKENLNALKLENKDLIWSK